MIVTSLVRPICYGAARGHADLFTARRERPALRRATTEGGEAVFETVFIVSLGCSLLGLGCWNIQVHRSINEMRSRHTAERARADAAMQALAARVSELDERSALLEPALPPSPPKPPPALRGSREAQALELAAAGAGRREIAERLSMRPADVELLVKVSAYRAQAG